MLYDAESQSTSVMQPIIGKLSENIQKSRQMNPVNAKKQQIDQVDANQGG